jgi:hypothetical protein
VPTPCRPLTVQDWQSDGETHPRLPPIERQSEPFRFQANGVPPFRPRDTYPAILSTDHRPSTLSPQRHIAARQRKHSVTKPHRRQRSREFEYMRRVSAYDRKAYSAEPSDEAAVYGKRWEDLIEAATSASEDGIEERTPVCRPTSGRRR